MKKLITSFLIVTGLLGASTGYATVSDYIPVQGILTTPGTGDKIDGLVDATFAIYNVATDGSALWTETYDSGTEQLNVVDGFFTVYLGKVTALDLSSFLDESELYLGITIGPTEMTPRIEIASAMYSGEAEYCNMATDFAVSGDLTVGGDVTVTGDYKYPSEKTGYLTLTAVDFRPVNHLIEHQFDASYGLYATSAVGVFAAPVHLPEGVTMTEFSVTLYDNDPSGDYPYCSLFRTSPSPTDGTESSELLATIVYNGNSSNNQNLINSSIINPIIDNENYGYYVFCGIWFKGTPHAIHNARITYTYTALGH